MGEPSGEPTPDLRRRCADTLRFLAVDAVEKAGSGHPGTPMGAADLAFALWHDHLVADPAAPDWIGRDRFVLSAGHASMLLYALLHCAGYDLPLDEIRRFRQWGSRTPGHPEYRETPGVEVTTGPLGQGFANGVGMALAARVLGARFNREGFPLVNHHVYALVSDGDMFEGVTAEAASLAGHLGLGNLVYVYDDNGITIEGETRLAFAEDVRRRFESYGWFVQRAGGHDQDAVSRALAAARAQTTRPALVIARTRIGLGSGKEGTEQVHGAPLGPDDVARAKRARDWPLDPPFLVPGDVRAVWRARAARMAGRRRAWEELLARWRAAYPADADLWDAHFARRVPVDLTDKLVAAAGDAPDATRKLSSRVLQKACELLPHLLGGSADLAPSTGTHIKGSPSIEPARIESDDLPDPAFAGRNLHFGVREHAMGAVCNGMVLHGGLTVYSATFLAFSDYMRPPIRLAALMRIPTVFVFTHDSIWLGEDGPTHQPIEHLWSLRLIPDLRVWRPADGVETAVAWAAALRSRDTPHVLVLTRQTLPALPHPAGGKADGPSRGGYVLCEAEGGTPDVTLVATGSEVGLAMAARERLFVAGVRARVVSMPCLEEFDAQPAGYRAAVLPPGSRRVAIEAGRGGPWARYVGERGLIVGIERFGASAPAEVVAEKLGFTPEAVTARVLRWMSQGDAT